MIDLLGRLFGFTEREERGKGGRGVSAIPIKGILITRADIGI